MFTETSHVRVLRFSSKLSFESIENFNRKIVEIIYVDNDIIRVIYELLNKYIDEIEVCFKSIENF